MSSSNFHCTCCNLSFSRKTNLQRHLKTESHINRQNNLCLEQKIKLLEERLESVEKMLLKNNSKDIEQSNNNIYNTTNNTTNNVIINNNITILPYGKENTNYLNSKVMTGIMKRLNVCIVELFNKIHFDANHPENHNIKMQNVRDNKCLVWQGNKWVWKPLAETIEDRQQQLIGILEDSEEDRLIPETIRQNWLNRKDSFSTNKKLIREISNKMKLCLLNSENEKNRLEN